jgi:hypothetical protein
MRFVKTKLAIAASGAGLLVYTAAPAALANGAIAGPLACGFLSLSLCGHGGVNQNNRHVYACDDLADGEGYGINYRLANGGRGTVIDGNGSAAGCGGRIVGSPTNRVILIQGCSIGLGLCTNPLPV